MNERNKLILYLLLLYISLTIIRPWESVSFVLDYRIERYFAIILIVCAFFGNKLCIVDSPMNFTVYSIAVSHFMLSTISLNPEYAFDQSVEYVKMVVVYIIALNVCQDEEDLMLFVKVIIFAYAVHIIHSLIEFSNGRHFYRMGIVRLIGTGWTNNDPNTFAASISLSLPFAFLLARVSDKLYCKLFYFFYIILGIVCILMTGSRSGLLSLLLLYLIYLFFFQKNKISKNIIMLLFVATVWSALPSDNKERIKTIWDPNAGNTSTQQSTKGRLFGLKAGWEMFLEKPLTGIGVGHKNFISYRAKHGDGVEEQAHNLLGEILGEMGLIGLILFVMFVNKIFRLSYRVFTSSRRFFIKQISLTITITMTLLLFLGLAGHNYYRPLWLWLAAMISVAYRTLCLNNEK